MYKKFGIYVSIVYYNRDDNKNIKSETVPTFGYVKTKVHNLSLSGSVCVSVC